VRVRLFVLTSLLAAGAAWAGADDDKMHIAVAHQFSKDDARARTQMLLDYWARAYHVKSSWSGDTAHVSGRVMGVKIEALLDVTESTVGGVAEDPGPLTRGLARRYITRKLQKYLHPQYLEP
jgi:hypothetical protein